MDLGSKQRWSWCSGIGIKKRMHSTAVSEMLFTGEVKFTKQALKFEESPTRKSLKKVYYEDLRSHLVRHQYRCLNKHS